MTNNNDIQFPINQALLEEATKIKQERRLVRERIEQIDSKKKNVSPKIYQKVKEDYVIKLNEVTNALLEKKTDIDKELASLYETRAKITTNLEQHKERLEEIKFRSHIGEYDNDKFQEIAEEESSKIGKFEKILAAVAANIERYEAIFANEEGLTDVTEPSVVDKNILTDELDSPAEVHEKNTSDFDINQEGGDYFSPDQPPENKPTSPSISETTKKAVMAARIIAIEGPLIGKNFPLKKESTLGRANTNMVALKDAKVSRQHAVIKQAGNDFMILDLNSSNGIYVNHERVKEHVLGDGDLIQIGDSVFQFKL